MFEVGDNVIFNINKFLASNDYTDSEKEDLLHWINIRNVSKRVYCIKEIVGNYYAIMKPLTGKNQPECWNLKYLSHFDLTSKFVYLQLFL